MWRLGWLGLCLLLAAGGPAAAADLQGLLDRFVEREELPGAVLLVSGPSGRQIAVAGMADRERRVPMGADSRFYIASVGKMMTAVAVLQLVGEGRADLDRPVTPLLPAAVADLRLANLRSATLRNLLDHSSGIPDYITDVFTARSREDPGKRWTALDALAFARGETAEFPVGQASSYSNSNYALLGLLLETADGAPLSDILARRVFAPAGMRDSVVVVDPADRRLAHGYADPAGDGRLRDVSGLSWNSVLGDGPATTTAGDMERFAFALFRDNLLLPASLVRRMIMPSIRDPAYGLGVERGEDRWGTWVGHTGLYDGFEAELWYYVERETVIVLLKNGHQTSDESFTSRVVAAVFGGR